MMNGFVKSPFSFLLILFGAFCAAAQSAPECALADAPRLLNLRLGMSPTEVRSVFGKDPKIKVKTKGDRTFFQNYINKRPPATLLNVTALYLRFLDGRLYQIEVFYNNQQDAPTLEAFARHLSARINLPQNLNWQFAAGKAAIDCGAFRLTADKPVNPRVELTDTARLAEAEARRKKSE
jgi:hypothetical protein